MKWDELAQQIEQMELLVAKLQQCDGNLPREPKELEIIAAGLENFSNVLEELRVANEELQRQNQELAATHQAVAAERQHYKELFEFVLDGSLVTDRYGTIQEANRAAATLLNCSQNFLVGKPLPLYVVEEERKTFRSQLNSLYQVDEVHQWEVSLQPLNKTPTTAEVRVAAIKSQDGRLVGWRWLLREITERKQMEEKVLTALEAERELSSLKSRIIKTLSHEYRTPLTIILSSTQLLKKYGNQFTQEKNLTYLQRIETSTKHMTNLVNDVLFIDKAKVDQLKFNPAPLDLEQLCQKMVREVHSGTHSQTTITFSSQGNCTDVNLDKKLLRLILLNLLLNAIKYSPHGGIIRFDVECFEDVAWFSIQDSGIGIPAEDLPRLFESFHRASNVGTIPGTGLGLVIVKKCVDLHGGQITVESEVDVGSKFIISLPYCFLKKVHSEQ